MLLPQTIPEGLLQLSISSASEDVFDLGFCVPTLALLFGADVSFACSQTSVSSILYTNSPPVTCGWSGPGQG